MTVELYYAISGSVPKGLTSYVFDVDKFEDIHTAPTKTVQPRVPEVYMGESVMMRLNTLIVVFISIGAGSALDKGKICFSLE